MKKIIYNFLSTSIIFILLSGCISFSENLDSIVVSYVYNSNSMFLNNTSYEDNAKLFSLKFSFYNSSDEMQIDYFKENQELIERGIKDTTDIKKIKLNTTYSFKIYIENINEVIDENVLGINNEFLGSILFKNGDSDKLVWKIEKKFDRYYKINEYDDNLLQLYLFPNTYNYKINFLFEFSSPRN